MHAKEAGVHPKEGAAQGADAEAWGNAQVMCVAPHYVCVARVASHDVYSVRCIT